MTTCLFKAWPAGFQLPEHSFLVKKCVAETRYLSQQEWKEGGFLPMFLVSGSLKTFSYRGPHQCCGGYWVRGQTSASMHMCGYWWAHLVIHPSKDFRAFPQLSPQRMCSSKIPTHLFKASIWAPISNWKAPAHQFWFSVSHSLILCQTTDTAPYPPLNAISSSSPCLMLSYLGWHQLPTVPFCRDKSYLGGTPLWWVPYGDSDTDEHVSAIQWAWFLGHGG